MTTTEIVPFDAGRWREHADAIMALERVSYEAGRCDPPGFFERVVAMARGASLLALDDGEVAGFCLGGPLESFPEVGGTLDDPRWGRGDTLYAADHTIAPDHRGRGLGTRLKRAQLERARALGYAVVCGRNRVGLADAMWRLNQRFGATQIKRLRGAYADGPEPRECIYYHIDLGHVGRRHEERRRFDRG